MSSPADIVIYGGGAGGGKSYGLLLEGLRNIGNPGFRGIIFRRTVPELTGGGGLWDESSMLYPLVRGHPNQTTLKWTFPSGAWVGFGHMQREKDCVSHQGKQYAFIGWDELTHFTSTQFWYLFSRNRSMCGVRPYMRGTCNPDPDSFVRKLIDWWIGKEGEGKGYPIPERSGVLRYFVRINDELMWGDSAEEMTERYPEEEPNSLTFIPAKLEDNPALTAKDPAYRSKLRALPLVERQKLLGGNWDIRPAAGLYYKREMFEIVDALPAPGKKWRSCRAWDRAASEPTSKYPDPDYTAGPKMETDGEGTFYVTDLSHGQWSANKVTTLMKTTATQDGRKCEIAIFQDPGASGKWEAQFTTGKLAGYRVRKINARTTGGKITHAGPVSSQAEAGNIKILRAPWNDKLIAELEAFPDGAHDDIVDGLSLAFQVLSKPRVFIV